MKRRNFIALMFGALVAKIFPSTKNTSTPYPPNTLYTVKDDKLITFYHSKDYIVLTWDYKGFEHQAKFVPNSRETYCYPSVTNNGCLLLDYPDGTWNMFAPTYTKELLKA